MPLARGRSRRRLARPAETYVLYSGFQYRYDPGVPLVGIGAFVLLAGLIISFYFLAGAALRARR